MFETEIIDIKDETWDVKTFRMKRPKGLDFKPGQYALFSFKNNKNMNGEKRPFTFSSSPIQKDYFEITVKKMTYFTIELFNTKIGDKIIFEDISGKELLFDENVKKDVVFIAGGSGITPFIIAIRYAVDKKMKNNITLFFSNKTIQDIIFRSELHKIEYNNKNIKIINIISTDTCNTPGYETGRISKEIIQKYVNTIDKKIFYICGPPPMIEAVKSILKELKVKDENIRIEPWQLPSKSSS